MSAMARHIGIVACSAEGAALCYRTICAEAPAEMGEECHPEITLHTHPFSAYMRRIRAGDWAGVAELMLASTRVLAGAGADFALSPDNTIHEAYDLVTAASPLPWLHIADVVADEAARRGYRRVGVLGTRFLMAGPVYPTALGKRSIELLLPEPRDREWINTVIFDELVRGVITERTRSGFHDVIERLGARGAEAAVLGCTEIPLIVRPDEAPLPTLDSTRLLARAAVRAALG